MPKLPDLFPLHQHMPEPAAAAALIIHRDLEGRQHIADGENDFIRQFIFNQAALHRDDGVAAGLIDAADRLAPGVQPEGGMDLIAVVQGLVHADDLLHRAKPAQQEDGLTLLMEKLLRIGKVLQLAAAAAAEMGAGGRISFTHGKHQLIIKLARIFSLSGFFPYYHRFAHLQSGQNVIKYRT